MDKYLEIGFIPCDILLPKTKDFTKWSVVACDQYTSQPDYWDEVKKVAGDDLSTLNMIYPEIYLNEENGDKRIENINNTMKSYLDSGVFEEIKNSFIYVERTVAGGKVRKGLVGAIDLEMYDYEKGSKAYVRATEGTVIERIPPRVKIRKNAPLELPHIMLLIDDEKDLVFGSIEKGEKVYDFDLMMESGNIKGYKVAPTDEIADAFLALKNAQDKDNTLLFAVGDGNHSLASAKATYEEVKASLGDAAKDHPARYALIEVVNIHDEALKFEPIYRIMTGVDPEDVISALAEYIATLHGTAEPQKIEYIYGNQKGILVVPAPKQQLTVGTLQIFIDEYIKSHNGAKVDYIHGEDSVKALAQKPNSIGFMFDGMAKSQLFKTVIFDGALPRKTFSMGHAVDKRYYLECRKIK
jgi:uncharacterized protein (DUF1015 family)